MKKTELRRFAIGSGSAGRRLNKSFGPIKKLLVNFANLTTCHGFKQVVVPNRRPIYRIIWAALVIGLFTGLGIELIKKLQEFLANDAITDLHEEFTHEMEFPAVTLCNVNRLTTTYDEIELARLTALSEAALSHVDKSVRKTRLVYSKDVKLENEQPLIDNYRWRYSVNDKWWDVAIEAYQKDLEVHNREVYYLREEFIAKGWQLNETTLRHCSYAKRKCSIANFSRTVTPMGLCYTFHAKYDAGQKIAGSGFGLQLFVDVNQYEYTKNESTNISSGVKVIIHHHMETPRVNNYGPTISAGHTGHITIEKTKRHLLPEPWGKCVEDLKELEEHEFYTVGNCMHECEVNFIVEACNCTPYWDGHGEVHECDALEIITCAGKAEADFPLVMTDELCDCHLPCEFVTYDIGGTSMFPSIELAKFLSTTAFRRHEEIDHVDDLDLVNEQFRRLQSEGKDNVMIDIFYDKLSYIVRSQKQAITQVSLMSDLGGLLGLWLGISIVTLAEFIQLGIDALELWFENYKKKKNLQMPFEKRREAKDFSKLDSQMFKSLDFWDEENEDDKDKTENESDQYG